MKSLALALALSFAVPAVAQGKPLHHRKAHAHRFVPLDASGNEVVGGRPKGCPRAFCGCEASLYLYGEIKRGLNLAANWLKFPRAHAAPHMAAVRKHHVFVLIRHVAGDLWFVHDGNSGHGKTREHVRSIKGYMIVNPNLQAASS